MRKKVFLPIIAILALFVVVTGCCDCPKKDSAVAEPAAQTSTTAQESFTVKMGGTTTTDDIVKVLEAEGLWVNSYVTQQNFPLSPSATAASDEIVLVPVPAGKWITESEGLEILKAAGLERPSVEDALRFAEQYATKTTSTERPFVVFLHESWQDPDGDRRVLYVDRDPGRRGLFLNFADYEFNDRCVLAGVRRAGQSSVQ